MSSVAFIFDIIFSCLITLILLYRCGNYRRQHPITTTAVFIAWFFSILIVFILPLDISLVCSKINFHSNRHCCIIHFRLLTEIVYHMHQQQSNQILIFQSG